GSDGALRTDAGKGWGVSLLIARRAGEDGTSRQQVSRKA
ncbi:hypothetical protein A2U01_0106554, partial [Trifolium medium]|nr:hypothetical protein [Trifolium medium]